MREGCGAWGCNACEKVCWAKKSHRVDLRGGVEIMSNICFVCKISGPIFVSADSNIKCKNNQRERKKSFLGERKFNLALGLSLILNCTALIKSSSREEKTVFLGIYCLISLFAFSMAPFCQEE